MKRLEIIKCIWSIKSESDQCFLSKMDCACIGWRHDGITTTEVVMRLCESVSANGTTESHRNERMKRVKWNHSQRDGIGGAVVQNIHDIITLANYIYAVYEPNKCVSHTLNAYVALSMCVCVCMYILRMCVWVRPCRAVYSIHKYIAIEIYWASAIDTVVRRNICALMSKSATHFSHCKYCVYIENIAVVWRWQMCGPTHTHTHTIHKSDYVCWCVCVNVRVIVWKIRNSTLLETNETKNWMKMAKKSQQ